MSENKRSYEEIQQEYGNLCAKAGHMQYQIRTVQKDLDLVNEQLADLNMEAALASKLVEKKEDSNVQA